MKRWAPGHYMECTDALGRTGISNSKRSLVAANTNFVGYQVSIWWGQTELNQGDYSALYTQLDAARTAARTDNKKIWLRLFERSFHGPVSQGRPNAIPQYIIDAGGAYAYTGAGENFYGPKFWDTSVSERFLLWAEKVADYVALNPEFVLVSSEEYTMSGAWLQSGYTQQSFIDLWQNFARRVTARSGDCLVHVNTGWSVYYPNNYSLDKPITDNLLLYKVLLGPTDLIKDRSSATLSTSFGSYMFNLPSGSPAGYRGVTGFALCYEWPDYSSAESPAEHLRWAVDDLGVNFIAWDPDKTSGSGTSGDWTWSQALSAVNAAGGRINTARPSLLADVGVPLWDGNKLPYSLASGAIAAANAAQNGSKNSAYLQYIRSAIGSNFTRSLERDGVVVWQGVCSGTLPISGSGFAVPTPATQTSVTTSDINSGEWIHYIRSSSNPTTNYIATKVTPTSAAGPAFLSGGITQGVPIVTSDLTLSGALFDTVSTSYPQSSDSRTVAWLDPRLTWAGQPQPVAGGFGGQYIIAQINSNWNAGAAVNPPISGPYVSMMPESGILSNGILVFNKENDPVDSSRKAIFHRVHPSAETLAGTARSAYNLPGALKYNATYWTAFACRWPTWPGQFTTIFDVHDNNWEPGPYFNPDGTPRYSPETQSPIQLQIGTDGIYRWQITGCYIPYYTRNDVTRSFSQGFGPVSSSSTLPSQWQYFILKWRCGRSLADAPSITVWNAAGSGPLSVQYSLTNTPIGLYDTIADNLYPKLGLYQFNLPLPAETTMYTKGIYVFRDEAGSPTITPDGLLSLLKSV